MCVDTIPKGMGDGDLGCCFSLTMSIGRNGRGYASQGAAGVGISGVGCQGQLTRAGVLGVPEAGVGILGGGCLGVVLRAEQGVSRGNGDEDPGCCFCLAISMERRCASQSPAGVGTYIGGQISGSIDAMQSVGCS